MRIREFVWPQDRIDHIDRHGVTPEEVEEACFGKTAIPPMEKLMSNSRLPKTDSIQELADFWDNHDITEFEEELEEVTERVFERDADITVHLETDVARVVREMARSRGVADWELIREWVLERIHGT